MVIASLDAGAFVARATQRLKAHPPGYLEPIRNPRGDHELELDGNPSVRTSLPKPAAVLVPIILRDGDMTMLLTQRASHLRSHSGQIAFPGGKIDSDDATPLETALRETEEEIGLARRHVRPIGYLDAYLSSSNYCIFPVVGLVSPAFSLTLNHFEVANAFEVPLSFVLDGANHELHSREWQGKLRQYYAIPFREHYIWGVTAGIIRHLYERLEHP